MMSLKRSQEEKAEAARILLFRRKARRELTEFVKASYPDYQAGWVHQNICERLERFSEAVANGESPRLMLMMPPRHGKSFLVSERFPVWHLGRYPNHEIVVASYGQSLSSKFSKRARSLAREALTRELFPGLVMDEEKQGIEEWATAAGGSYKAVGVGGALTGSGSNILIIDDPVKDAEQAHSSTYRENTWDWYTSTAYTRLMPGGGVLICQTRWHEDDLAGRLIAAQSSGDQWEIVSYPAIAERDEVHRKIGEALHPERYSVENLHSIKLAVGSRVWEALYQQKPTSTEGGIVKRDWLKYCRSIPTQFDQIIQSWDATFKDTKHSDYVVGQVWGIVGADCYLLDQVRDRMDFPATIQAIRNLTAKWPQATAKIIEDKANGPAIISSLKREIQGLIPYQPEGSKEARLSAVSPQFEAGNIWLPDPALSPWVGDFVEELLAFPNGAHDDQVDACSQALLRLTKGGFFVV